MVAELSQSVKDRLASKKKDYDKSIAENDSICESLGVGMVVRFVDGDLLISDSDSSKSEGGVLGACNEFEEFEQERLKA